MVKKVKAWRSATEKSDKSQDPSEEMRGRIVQTGVPLWQQNGRKRHLQFKAGKMYVIDNMVHADPRKGYVCIDQDYDHVMHFCWMEREGLGAKEDDLAPEPYDSIFKRVPKCTTGRVFILKIRSTNKNYFFWMQEPAAEKDVEISAKVNYLLNFPPPWLRFPQIACNIKMPQSPSQTSYYSAESNISEQDQPLELTEVRNDETYSSQTLSTILQEALPGLLEMYKTKISSKTETLHYVPPAEMSPMLQDTSDIVTPDSIRLIIENPDYMKELENLLPVLEDGKRDSLQNSVDSNRFKADMRAFTDAVKNGGLGPILRNLDLSDRSAATAKQGCWKTVNLFSDDSDSEYADAVDGEDFVFWVPGSTQQNVSGLGKHDPESQNTGEIDAALVGNIGVKLNCGKTETTPATDKPPQHGGSDYDTNEASMGSNGNRKRKYTSEKTTSLEFQAQETGRYSQITNYTPSASIALHENVLVGYEGPSHEVQEHVDSNMDPKNRISNQTYFKEKDLGKRGLLRNDHRWSDNIRAMTSLAAALTDKKKSNCGATGATPRNWNDPPQPGTAVQVPTSLNGKQIEKRKFITEKNIYPDRNRPETGNETPEHWESTSELNFQLDCIRQDKIRSTITIGTIDEQGGNNTQTEDHIIEKSIAREESFLTARGSMESTRENTLLGGSSQGNIVRESLIHSEPSVWESTTEPNFNLDYNDRHSPLSTIPANNGQYANNTRAEDTIIDGRTSTMEKSSISAKESSHESILHETQNHITANYLALSNLGVVTAGKGVTLKTCSEVEKLTVGWGVEEEIEVRQAIKSPGMVEGNEQTVSFKTKEKIPLMHQPLVLLDPQRYESMGVSAATTTSKESSTSPRTDDPGEPGCSYTYMREAVPPPSDSRGCGTKILADKSPPSSVLQNILERPGPNVLIPMPFESDGLDSKSRDTVLSTFTSFITFSSSSVSRGIDGDNSTIQEMCNTSKLGTAVQENEDGDTAKNENTSLDDRSNTNIAMMVLVPSISSGNINKDAKEPTKTVSSTNPQGSVDPTRNVVQTSGTGNEIQGSGVKMSGSASSLIGGSVTSSRRGPQDHPPKPKDALPNSQKASNSGTKSSAGKKSVAPNKIKSLEEIIYVSGPHKEVSYNLRKRPLPSLSGPAMNAESSQGRQNGKRPRVSSPGVPLPSPFRVTDASPIRLNRPRHPQVSGSTNLLSSPNQGEGRDRAVRKRPNWDESSLSDQEEPPTKKARTSDGKNSSSGKLVSSRPLEGRTSSPRSKTPAAGSSGQSCTLNTSPLTPTNESASNDSSQSADPSLRYNLRKRSAKIEDGQQTEPVRIREIRNTRPETKVRTRTVSRVPPDPVNRTIRNRSQNTRPVIIEDSSKSKPNSRKPPDSDGRPKQ